MEYKRLVNRLVIIASIVSSISVVAGVIVFYKSNIWRPSIKVLTSDFKSGLAKLHINGEDRTLYKNSTLAVGGTWGLRFNGPDDNTVDRIELIKSDMVYEIIQTA